jgi:glycosyltransferase involved in cell wall biosynthesis
MLVIDSRSRIEWGPKRDGPGAQGSQKKGKVMELSIVMPCLNESETLAECIEQAQRYLARSGVAGEIIVADNGSTDGSQQIARGLGARVVDVPVHGYGAALSGAVSSAKGRYCIMGDSDASYDFEHLDGFIEKLREGYDLVMGNRFKGGIAPGAMPWKNRYLGNPILSGIGRFFFHSLAGDFHCGIRGFSKHAFDLLDLRTTGMEFASEMVIKATLMKLRIAEVPTTLRPDGRSRPPHLRPYRDGWRHLRFMLLFSPNWLFLYPGSTAMLIGLVVGAALFAQPIFLHNVRLGLDSLIYCGTLLIVGFQAVLFSLLSRAYAIQQGIYPGTSRFQAYFRHFTLERGLILGAVVTLAGCASAVYAFWQWKRNAFGLMEIERIGRIVIPSSVAISLGIEMILFSFMLSTLEMNVRRRPSAMIEIEPNHASSPAAPATK